MNLEDNEAEIPEESLRKIDKLAEIFVNAGADLKVTKIEGLLALGVVARIVVTDEDSKEKPDVIFGRLRHALKYLIRGATLEVNFELEKESGGGN